MSNYADFNQSLAPRVADAIGAHGTPTPTSRAGYSDHFLHVEDRSTLTMVVPPGLDKTATGTALARGLHLVGDRELRLALPEDVSGGTLLRTAFLTAARRPTIWGYGHDLKPRRLTIPSVSAVLGQFAKRLGVVKAALPVASEADFTAASRPKQFNAEQRQWIEPLIDIVASRLELDPCHRKGYRAWQFAGQKILEISSKKDGHLVIRAGIQNEENVLTTPVDRRLKEADVTRILRALDLGIEQRRPGGDYHVYNEAWLQSLIGRQPFLVGIEGRSLREVPAWRRAGHPDPAHKAAWGRGYIDLLGVDSHGVIQIVETKLSSKNDPMFGFQGVDYFAYCMAYRAPITKRLDMPERAPLSIRYVLGTDEATARIHPAAKATLDALDDDVPFDLMGVSDWHKLEVRRPAAAKVSVGAPD